MTDLNAARKREIDEAKMEQEKATAESYEKMVKSSVQMASMWKAMWRELTDKTWVPDEVAKNWMDCYVHHTLASSANSTIAERMHHMTMEKIKEIKREEHGPDLTNDSF